MTIIERFNALPQWAFHAAAAIAEQQIPGGAGGGAVPLYKMPAPLKIRLIVDIAEALIAERERWQMGVEG